MNDDPADKVLARTRRRLFLKQAGIAAGIGLGAGWMSLAPTGWPLSLKDPDGERGKPRTPLFRLPANGFGVPSAAVHAQVGIAYGQRIEAMVRAAVDAIGGMAHFISSGDIVLIKPNVAFERSAPLGATTHPEVMTALIRQVFAAGASEVRVADNPIESPASCFARSGIERASVEAGARVYLPVPSSFETLQVPNAKWIERWPFFAAPLRGANKVIGVAPVKDHNLCRASLTTKNWYGLLGGRRNLFHQDIHGIIADLALMMRPTFVLLDATRVLFRNGPTGGSLADVRPGNALVASTDSLAADAFGWDQLLERKGEERPAYLKAAAAQGLGEPAWETLRVKEVRLG